MVVLNATELCIFKWLLLYYVNFTSIFKKHLLFNYGIPSCQHQEVGWKHCAAPAQGRFPTHMIYSQGPQRTMHGEAPPKMNPQMVGPCTSGEGSHSICPEDFRISGLGAPGYLPSSPLGMAVLMSLSCSYCTEGNWAVWSSSFILLLYYVFIGCWDTAKRLPCLTRRSRNILPNIA